jgi:hypothetical protein
VARNARVLAAAGLLARLAALATAAVLARGLGQGEFSRYLVAVSIASLLGVLVVLGTGGAEPLIAIAPAAIVVLGFAAVPLAVRLVFGSAAYVVALILLRTFDAHDSEFLRASCAVPRTRPTQPSSHDLPTASRLERRPRP